MRRRVIPGFGLALGTTVLYLGAIVLLPLCALLLKASGIGAAQLWEILSAPRTLSAIRVTVTMAFAATIFNAVYGLLLAWVLARYSFPGKRLLDALVDVPFALPTAVAGLALTALFAKNGWFGAPLDKIGIAVAYTPLGIAIAMAFTSIPFVVRTVQPVIEDLGSEVEEAGRSLGANDLQILWKIIFPAIFPAFLAGCSLSFARSLGEFGAVIFIAGNQPMKTEIVALLTYIRLEEYNYQGAAAISAVMLLMAFAMLVVTNAVQAWHLRYVGRGEILMSIAAERDSEQAEWMQHPVGGGKVTRRIVLWSVLALTALFLVAPLVLIVTSGLSLGIGVFVRNLTEPSTLHAIGLTLLTALIVVPINILFGLAAAWTVTKFDFRGKTLLIALIELPYSVSPIVAGVAYLFVYGSQGLFGPLLEQLGIKVMFALPAIFLASLFVTAPFVARELIPLMQVQGTDEEEAAVTLGAGGFTTFWRVTLPNVKWAVVYGAILCNARVMGEFGAVSVVSGNIRGQTTTLPLQIELLYQDYNVAGAFAAATVLTAVALVTILIKVTLERYGKTAAAGPGH